MKIHFKSHGFTMLELLIVIGVLGVLVSIALPSFSDMMDRMGANSAAKSVAATINLARSEAVKRGLDVSICGSTDGVDCASDSWSSGWVVFVDNNNDVTGAAGSIDLAGPNPDEIIRVYEPLLNMTLQFTDSLDANVDLLGYNGRGFGLNADVLTFGICPLDNNADYARQIVVGFSGRARLNHGGVCE